MMIHSRLAGLAKDVWPWLALLVGIGVAISAAAVGQGWLIAYTIATLWGESPTVHWLVLLSGIAALIGIRAGLLWLREVVAAQTTMAVKRSLRQRLFARLLELGPGWMATRRTGEVQSTIIDGVEALEGYLSYYLPQAIVAVIVPLALLIYLATIDPLIAGVLLGCALIVPFIPRWWDRVLGEYGQRHWMAYSQLAAQFLDAMQGIVTLKVLNASRRHGERLKQDAEDLYRATMMQIAISLLTTGFVQLAMSAGVTSAVILGVWRLSVGVITPAELLIILFLAAECFRPFIDLDKYWHQGYMGITAAPGIFALLDAKPLVTQSSLARLPIPTPPDITFANVSFTYPGADRLALRQFSLRIAPGETVAIVGPSGAGKSTVIALLLRFFDPDEGCILSGGHDIRIYDREQWWRQIAVVSQETFLFSGTIADNIRLARPDASDAEVEAAAHAAGIHDVITALPDGYHTLLGERGFNLSGGQRQRIAIARALLKDAPLLIFDEATANVDSVTETAIQAAINQLRRQRTLLIVAHRLSTVKDADRIVVLEDGRLREAGKHSELVQQPSLYARLAAMQEGGEV